jgi:hypothetical protein
MSITINRLLVAVAATVLSFGVAGCGADPKPTAPVSQQMQVPADEPSVTEPRDCSYLHGWERQNCL